MTLEVKEPIETEIHCKQPDGNYVLKMRWGLRMACLNVFRYNPTELYVHDITLEDIEKIIYDLMKIIEEERK